MTLIKKLILPVIIWFSLFTNHLLTVEFNKVVIWGHKLGSHTHSYIHNAFNRAFKHLGHPTYWFDDQDDVSNFDFSNTLFITEGQVDKNIPLRSDCLYMLHNISEHSKYIENTLSRNRIYFQVYTDDVLSRHHLVKVDNFIYYDISGQCVYMPWATDLLPQEIDSIKRKLKSKSSKRVNWVGSIGGGLFGNIEQIEPFIKACNENGIEFIQSSNKSLKENINLISESYMAPAIVGKWQQEKGYIPCRIFKNISYGKMGITNSKNVYELFERKIVYNPNTYELFYDAKKKMKNITKSEIFALMDLVKTKHTYINRIQTMLSFFDLVQNEQK